MEASITTETNTIPITPPPTKPDHEAIKITIPKDTLSHSSSTGSSSPDSPLVADPFKTDEDDDGDKSVSSSPRKLCTATEAPCSQEMERPAYRIPASVFARNESKEDMDWSVASNEELFSIHEENASFKNGRGSFWRPGDDDDDDRHDDDENDDDDDDDEASTSTTTTGHMFSYTAQQPKCAEVMKSRELGLLAAATMKEVIMESETHQIDFHIPLQAMTSQCSRGSSTSTKSFAFSSKNHGLSRTHSSVRSVPEEQVQCQPQTQVAVKSKSKSEAKVEAEARPEPQPAVTNCDQKTDQAPTGSTAQRKRWFPNLFSCCSL